MIRDSKVEIIGNLPEGDNRFHAVFRTSSLIGGERVVQANVFSLRRRGGRWYTCIPDTVFLDVLEKTIPLEKSPPESAP